MIVAISDMGGSGRGLVRSLFVWPPIVPVLLFAVLGIDHELGGKWRRLVLLALFLVPYVMAIPMVVTPSSLQPLEEGSILTMWIGMAATVVTGAVSFEICRWLARPSMQRGQR
jgi:hypothetical protein